MKRNLHNKKLVEVVSCPALSPMGTVANEDRMPVWVLNLTPLP